MPTNESGWGNNGWGNTGSHYSSCVSADIHARTDYDRENKRIAGTLEYVVVLDGKEIARFNNRSEADNFAHRTPLSRVIIE
jgi:hypothetical protein